MALNRTSAKNHKIVANKIVFLLCKFSFGFTINNQRMTFKTTFSGIISLKKKKYFMFYDIEMNLEISMRNLFVISK